MIQMISTLEGVDRVLLRFDRIERGLSDLSPFWEKFGEQRHTEEKQLFDAAPWPALTPAYAERKRKIFGDKPILRATDTLFKSLTEKGSPGNVHRVSSLTAEFGSAVSYGVFHIPKRDPRAEPNMDRYQTLAEEQLNEMIREAGFN
jgi:hypothetical protein